MSEKLAVDLGSVVDTMVHSGKVPSTEELARVAETLAKMFDVDPDEVAILAVSAKGKNLKFVIPEKLAVVGSIPLTSTNALAAARMRLAGLSSSSARFSSVSNTTSRTAAAPSTPSRSLT